MTPGTIACIAAVALAPAAPAVAFEITATRYACDRGVEVPAAYVNAPEGSAVVLHVDGRQIVLQGEPAASGARYAHPSGGSGYVWLSKGAEAVLLWKDGAAGTEAAILGGCREAG